MICGLAWGAALDLGVPRPGGVRPVSGTGGWWWRGSPPARNFGGIAVGELLAKLLELLPDWVGWSLVVLVFGGLGAAWLYQTLAARRRPGPPAGPTAPPG